VRSPREHVAGRAKVLAATSVLVLVATALSARLPDPTEDDVRERLSEALAGAAVEDFVWLPSRGRVDDLVEGRGVVVLAVKPGELADVHVARVALWQGRPLRVLGAQPVLPTPLGRERALAARGSRFAYVVERDGVDETVVVADADSPTVFALTSDVALGRVDALGLDDTHVLARLTRGSRAVGLAAPLEQLPAHGFAEVARVHAGVHPATLETRVAEGLTSFEGEPRLSLVEGHPAIVERGSASDGLRLFDGRQLTFELVPGFGSRSDTGARSRGLASRGGAIVAAYELVGLDGGGFAGSRSFSAVDGTEPVLSSRKGELRIGLGAPADAEVAIPLASASPEEDLASLCTTHDGHLAMAWSRPSRALPETCEVVVTFRGAFVAVAEAETVTTSGSANPVLVIRAAERGPARVGDGDSQLVWNAEGSLGPPPSFLPAVFRAEMEALGAKVTLFQLDATRFDFRWVVGSAEKSHRLGGSFEVGVPAGSPPLQLGLLAGTGKRRKPRGLVSFGNHGHPFSLEEGVLLAGDGWIDVQRGKDLPRVPQGTLCVGRTGSRVAGGAAAPALGVVPGGVGTNETCDASELPLSVVDGGPSERSRTRGPLQSRADLCLVQGHVVLVAQSEFDSHEANATVLTELGCDRAVSLDRGSEHPSSLMRSPPSDLTWLGAFERPLLGRARSDAR
jgi:hypothetical protein